MRDCNIFIVYLSMAISLLVSLVNVFPGEVVVGWLALGLTGLCIK
jgi:hypothetical protein